MQSGPELTHLTPNVDQIALPWPAHERSIGIEAKLEAAMKPDLHRTCGWPWMELLSGCEAQTATASEVPEVSKVLIASGRSPCLLVRTMN